MLPASFSKSSSSGIGMSARNRFPTSVKASRGHGWNSSTTMHEISAGNFRPRIRKASPTGEWHSTKCRFFRTRSRKNWNNASRSSGTPAAFARLRIAPKWLSYSSRAKRSGMLPEARKSLRKTRKRSSAICPSVRRKAWGLPGFTAALTYMSCRSSFRSAMPYVWFTRIVMISKPAMKQDSRDSDCLPLPPTPTNSAFPHGKSTTRQMRQMCSMASWNRTRFISANVSLYSASFSSRVCLSCAMSRMGRYFLSLPIATLMNDVIRLSSAKSSTKSTPAPLKCFFAAFSKIPCISCMSL
mmetsp:Transcript_30011/g.77201  ORF Transcript_30011/g.77201 Transcript_30011/m.77201 type:complete len:298 (-) Transcript_30011:327-1220(-)